VHAPERSEESESEEEEEAPPDDDTIGTPLTEAVPEIEAIEEKADSDYSFEMPTKYKKAFDQNNARFNDITLNIKRIFDNIEKPFTNKKVKKLKTPKLKNMKTLAPKSKKMQGNRVLDTYNTIDN
jgi:hypothetical protein